MLQAVINARCRSCKEYVNEWAQLYGMFILTSVREMVELKQSSLTLRRFFSKS